MCKYVRATVMWKTIEEKTCVFAVSEPSAKVFSAKFCEIRNAHVAYNAGVLRMRREGHT